MYGKKKLAKKDIAPADFADKAALEEQAALAERQAAEESAKRAQVPFWFHDMGFHNHVSSSDILPANTFQTVL